MTNNTEVIMIQIIQEALPLVGAAIGLIGGYFLTRKRIAFEKIYERRLMCLKDLYKQIVNLEFIIKEYVHFVGADMKKEAIDERINSLRKIKDTFQKFQHKFWKEEIILNKNTTKVINNFLTKYIKITSKLTVSNIQQQQGDLKLSFDNWDKSFESVKKDLPQIKDELKKAFRKTLKI